MILIAYPHAHVEPVLSDDVELLDKTAEELLSGMRNERCYIDSDVIDLVLLAQLDELFMQDNDIEELLVLDELDLVEIRSDFRRTGCRGRLTLLVGL